MQFTKKFFCNWNFVRDVSEESLKQEDGSFLTLSITNAGSQEIMIFLGKEPKSSEFEVRVYKEKPGFIFAPNAYDEFIRFEENEMYDTFFFEKFEKAREFIDIIPSDYPEYRARPYNLNSQCAS